jgi:L-alanine-DL-glutamate epimerase-like enolase superfamily enzyme
MAGPTITAVEAIPLAVTGTKDFRISEGRTRRHVSVLAATAEAHFAAAAPNLILPVEIGSLRPMGVTTDIISESLFGDVGFVTVPPGPGLGATVDWKAVAAAHIEGAG